MNAFRACTYSCVVPVCKGFLLFSPFMNVNTWILHSKRHWLLKSRLKNTQRGFDRSLTCRCFLHVGKPNWTEPSAVWCTSPTTLLTGKLFFVKLVANIAGSAHPSRASVVKNYLFIIQTTHQKGYSGSGMNLDVYAFCHTPHVNDVYVSV